MSPRRFDGWTPREVTTVTAFDEQGRAVRWETVTEPEWDRRQRSLVMAYGMWEASLCRRCGEDLHHATDPNTDPDRPESTQAWVANDPDECFSCKALVRSEREWAKDDETGQSGWLIHTTELATKRPRLRSR